MSVIGKPNKEALNPDGNINVPAMEMPTFRYLLAQERKTIKNILIQSPYALGDCVCAEPAIRYAVENFKGCDVSLLTSYPELFTHIPLKKMYYTKNGNPNWDDYYVLKCYYAADELQSDFIHNFNVAIGDYISTCLFKGQLPTQSRNIVLKPRRSEEFSPSMNVVIHAGKHWPSKTFPKIWWDEIISELLLNGVKPTLIGADIDDGKRGTVAVDSLGCHDLRNELTVMESVEVLQNAKVVLTNDSAPLHMAASGSAWIGFVSTVRHPDFVSHWRPDSSGKNQWAYKMHDFSKGRMWTDSEVNPIKNGSKYDVIDVKTLQSWLPDTHEVVEWTMGKLAESLI